MSSNTDRFLNLIVLIQLLAVIFANRRVLHGRTAFDPTSGDRHLKGTYLDLDVFKDKLRVLSEKFQGSN